MFLQKRKKSSVNRQEAEEKTAKTTKDGQQQNRTEQNRTEQDRTGEHTPVMTLRTHTLCSHLLDVLFLAALCIESYLNLLFQPLRKLLALNHILIRPKKGIKTHTAPQASRKANMVSSDWLRLSFFTQ